MRANHEAFTVRDTHGILSRPEQAIEASSDRLGWSSLYVSKQRECAYRDTFKARDDHLIILHRDGPVRVIREIGGDRMERIVQPGGLFILPARCDFAVELSGSLSTIHLYVRAAVVREAAAELAVGDADRIEILPRLGERDAVIEQAALTACELMQQGVAGDWFAESLARMLAVQLLCRHSTASRTPAVSCGLSAQRLAAVDVYIADHLEKRISLPDLASAAALSPIHFARQFKKSTGRSPHQYLLAARVETAKSLLRGNISIAEVAYRCGFSHQEHLTRMFGKLAGVTPGAFRRQARS